MQSEDWIQRQIDELCRFTAKFMFATDTVLFDAATASVTARGIYDRINRLLEHDDICGAEDALFEEAQAEDLSCLALACDFYSRLNALPDTALEAAAFPRDEVFLGLKNILRFFSVPVIDEA